MNYDDKPYLIKQLNQMTLPDYSEYLKQPGMLAFIEQEWKANPEMHRDHAIIVNEIIQEHRLKNVIEFGCGTGEVARQLDVFNYVGIDLNSDCIGMAASKSMKNINNYQFLTSDVRKIDFNERDLVFCFGFLKHFGLHEWYDIFKKVSSFGEYFIFDIPIANETKDDGVEFHHVWKEIEGLRKNIHDIGFTVLDIINAGSVEPVFICKKK